MPANPGKVFSVGPEIEAEGTYESHSFDAQIFSQWGSLEWWSPRTAGENTKTRDNQPRVEFFARDRDNRMSPSSTKRRAIRYRYYVSPVLAEGRKEEAGSVCRVPAAEIETLVIGAIRSHVNSCPTDSTDRAIIGTLLRESYYQARIGQVILKACN